MFVSCVSVPSFQYNEGKTMGSSYHIKYKASKSFQPQIDSLLENFNQSVSTYIPTSTISQFNDSGHVVMDPNFRTVFWSAYQIFADTKGAFNPTVMPLVNYWGFGYDKKATEHIDSTVVDSLRKLVMFSGFVEYNNYDPAIHDTIYELDCDDFRFYLDFSAIAKGFGVDLVAELLESHGVTDYLVEIGGEVRVKGLNEKEKEWIIGIEKPEEGSMEHDQFMGEVHLGSKAMATSGNYRNFKEIDGVKVSHTINPVTGYPERNDLLSVSVVANDCMTADAYATACMVLGSKNALEMLKYKKGIEAYFIYQNEKGEILTTFTPGFKQFFLSANKDDK